MHAIVDVELAERAGWPPAELARVYLEAGAPVVQIRAKHLPSGPFLEICDALVRFAAATGAAVIVNDRADLARMAGAAGVHVGQDDLSPGDARRIVGERAIVGLSTHTLSQAESALREPLGYMAAGPVFGTGTKDTGYDPVGLDFVATAARLAGRLPVVGIGGITLENARSVLDAGAAAVAVISDLLAGGNPRRRVQAYLQRLAGHRV